MSAFVQTLEKARVDPGIGERGLGILFVALSRVNGPRRRRDTWGGRRPAVTISLTAGIEQRVAGRPVNHVTLRCPKPPSPVAPFGGPTDGRAFIFATMAILSSLLWKTELGATM